MQDWVDVPEAIAYLKSKGYEYRHTYARASSRDLIHVIEDYHLTDAKVLEATRWVRVGGTLRRSAKAS